MAGGSQRLWLLLLGVLLTVVCLNLISPVSCRPTRNKRQQESDYSVSSSWGSSSSQEWQDSESFADSMSSVFTSHEGYSSTDSTSSEEDEPPPPPRKWTTPAKKRPAPRRTTPKPRKSSSVMLKLESAMLLVPVGVLIRIMYPI